MLHHRRGVDEAEDAVAVNEAVHQFLFFRALGMDGDVADAFAGQRQVFRVRSGDDCPRVEQKRRGIFQPVVNQFAVGFVADEVNLGAVLCFFFPQQFPDLAHHIGAVNHAGGIVRRINDNRFGFGTDGLFQDIEFRQELRIGGR